VPKVDASKYRWACVGPATAKAMEEHGIHPEFVGDGNNPEKVAAEFSSRIGNEAILFPSSSLSKKTIINALPPDIEAHYTAVYKNALIRKKIEVAHIYYFTSPSNVEAFHLENSIPASATVWAIGTITEKSLREIYPNREILVPDKSLISELVRSVNLAR